MQKLINWFKNLFKKDKKKKPHLKINDGVGGRPKDRTGG
jgi:hypothetical protein